MAACTAADMARSADPLKDAASVASRWRAANVGGSGSECSETAAQCTTHRSARYDKCAARHCVAMSSETRNAPVRLSEGLPRGSEKESSQQAAFL